MLIATDLGDDAAESLEVARAFHLRHPGPLFVVHVIPSMSRPQMLFPQAVQRDAVLALDVHQIVSARLRALVPEDLTEAEIFIEEGDAAERLLAFARERAIDVIVLGGRDPGGKRMFGSVAEAVLTHSEVPVLVTRPHAATNEIVAATDLGEQGMFSVSRALWAASPTGARVTVVNVRPRGEAGLDQRLLAPVRETIRQVDAVVLEEGDPAPAIVALAERRDAELIVVASHSRKGFARLMIGSVASSVVRKASCSVLVVPLSLAPSATRDVA